MAVVPRDSTNKRSKGCLVKGQLHLVRMALWRRSKSLMKHSCGLSQSSLNNWSLLSVGCSKCDSSLCDSERVRPQSMSKRGPCAA